MNIHTKVKFLVFLKSQFIHCYGNHDDLLNKHGINVNRFYKEILRK